MSLARQFVATDKVEAQRALLAGEATTKEVVTATIVGRLPGMIKDAARKLATAATAAEILDTRDAAKITYTTAQISGRIAKAKGAHDQVVAAAHRAQADALDIEAAAKRRLADEYDGAQQRGEVSKGRPKSLPDGNTSATAAQIGIPSKEIHDARQIRDVIAANPTAVREALDDILAKGDEPTRAALRKAIAPAAKTARAEEQTAKKGRRLEREVLLAEKIKALPGKCYGVILADPEWRFEPYSRETGMDRAADNHYPTSVVEEIMARDVPSIAADDCILFLWATAPMLPQALQVLAAWGFTYKTHAIWFKQRAGEGRGTGYWFLGEHELLLVGTRGNVVAPAMGTQFRSVFEAPVGAHSEKPEVSFEIIESYFPTIPKIELNRRGPARPGWDAWGLEAEEPHSLPTSSPEAETPAGDGGSRTPAGNHSMVPA
ncbi:MT-A70 family methyltransferase [Mesorhizobium sp.]|uniref:MT-A70 family methyltransferase n=2 Tax=Mesorhizobium sp. TaxID=1871066 RepID=UPI00257C5912|nr:MT-A70 family methyltransferase [Mesorhizobium sp.]